MNDYEREGSLVLALKFIAAGCFKQVNSDSIHGAMAVSVYKRQAHAASESAPFTGNPSEEEQRNA